MQLSDSWKISAAVIASAMLAITVVVAAAQDVGHQPEAIPVVRELPQMEQDVDRLVQLVMDLHVHYCVRDGGGPDDCRRQAQQRANGE